MPSAVAGYPDNVSQQRQHLSAGSDGFCAGFGVCMAFDFLSFAFCIGVSTVVLLLAGVG